MRCLRMLALSLALSFAASPAFAQTGWTVFAPTGGNFSILIPAQPEVLPVENEKTNGITTEIHLFRVRTPGLIYIFGWTEYNQKMDVEGEIDADRDNFVKGMKGKLLDETRISQGGVSGRDFTGENAETFFISRVFVSGSRAWQSAVLVRTGTDDTRAAMKFLYSLQLTGIK